MYLYLGLPCTCVRHMRMRRMLPPMHRIGKSGRRVADRRGTAPAVVVEVEASAGGPAGLSTSVRRTRGCEHVHMARARAGGVQRFEGGAHRCTSSGTVRRPSADGPEGGTVCGESTASLHPCSATVRPIGVKRASVPAASAEQRGERISRGDAASDGGRGAESRPTTWTGPAATRKKITTSPGGRGPASPPDAEMSANGKVRKRQRCRLKNGKVAIVTTVPESS